MEARIAALLVLLFAASSAAAPPSPQEAAARSELELRHRAETRARYGHAAWTRGAVRGGLANELVLPAWTAVDLEASEGLVTRSFRRADAAGAPPSFVIESRVADTAEEAHEALVTWLAGVQSAQTMPSLAELGLPLGDAGFAGRSGAGPAALAWIAFVRGNVAVRVSACDPVREPALDLGAVASTTDQAILAAPALEGAVVRPVRPVIARLSATRATVVAGEVVRIELAIDDPARGIPHIGWTVGGPGQGYVERGADGTWELHTTGPGALTLVLEATGSTGTWTRGELRLDVLDD